MIATLALVGTTPLLLPQRPAYLPIVVAGVAVVVATLVELGTTPRLLGWCPPLEPIVKTGVAIEEVATLVLPSTAPSLLIVRPANLPIVKARIAIVVSALYVLLTRSAHGALVFHVPQGRCAIHVPVVHQPIDTIVACGRHTKVHTVDVASLIQACVQSGPCWRHRCATSKGHSYRAR